MWQQLWNRWNQLSDLLRDLPTARALLIALAALVLAQLTNFISSRLLRAVTSRTRTDFDDRLLALLERPVFYTVFFGGLSLAVRQLPLPPLGSMVTVRILLTLIALLWLGFGFRACGLVLELLQRHHERFPIVEERTLPLFNNLGKVLVFGLISYVLLAIWKVDATAWLTSAGIVGIAVGFAAKDTLANLFAGLFILADTPYKIGDFIVLDSGERGRVTHVGVRSTRLLTRDDIEITIPNAVIANAKIVNESGGPWEKERLRIQVSCAYGSDVDQVCDVLSQAALSVGHVCPEPEPRVRFRSFGDSGLNFELLCWIDEPVLRGLVTHDLNMTIYKAFAREAIEIPYPKQDVYIRELPAPRPVPGEGGP